MLERTEFEKQQRGGVHVLPQLAIIPVRGLNRFNQGNGLMMFNARLRSTS